MILESELVAMNPGTRLLWRWQATGYAENGVVTSDHNILWDDGQITEHSDEDALRFVEGPK